MRGETWGHLTYRNTFRVGYPDKLIFSPRDDKHHVHRRLPANPGTWIKAHTANAAVMVSHDRRRDLVTRDQRPARSDDRQSRGHVPL